MASSKTSTNSKASSFVEQAFILAAASLFVRFIGFLYRLPLTNLIGDEGNAFYAAGYNIYTFALIMSSAGLPAAISKMVSERLALKQYRNADEIFKAAMLVALSTGLISSLFLLLGATWLAKFTKYPEAVYAIRTLSPTIFIVAVMAVFRGYFQGMHNTIPTALSQVAEQIFNAIFSIWLAYYFFDKGLDWAAAGGTAGTGIGAVAGLLVVAGIYALLSPDLKKRVRRDRNTAVYEPRSKLINEVIRTALPIIIGMSIFNIANTIDMVMISDRLEASKAFSYDEIKVMYGQFSGKYILLTTLPVSISLALATAAIPSIAGSNATLDRKSVRRKINMALRLSMIISIPAAVGLGVLGTPILQMLFPTYRDGGYLLQYGAGCIILLAMVQIVTGMLQGIGKVNLPIIGALVGALAKIPINYFLIANPTFNILGALISTYACYLIAAAFDLYFLHKHTKITPDVSSVFVKPLLASAVMGLACYVSYNTFMYLSGHSTISVLITLVIAVLVYALFMLLIGGFRKTDILMLPMGNRLVRLMKM